MAWNGSSEKNTSGTSAAKRPVGGARKSSSIMRGAFAALAVVALAVGSWLWLFRQNDSVNTEPTKQNQKPKETRNPAKPKPEAAKEPKAEVAKEESPSKTPGVAKPKPQRFGKYEVEVDENGERWIYRDGKRRHIMSVKPGTSRQLFFNRAENQLSALLTVKPGETIVGFDIDDRRFVDDFLASLKTPIEMTDDDTPEERAEKELVIEAKKQLQRYYKEGLDIAEIMKQEYREIAKLNAMKTDLNAEIDKMRREGASPEDIRLQVEASNKMLEQYGVDHKFKLLRAERFALEQ